MPCSRSVRAQRVQPLVQTLELGLAGARQPCRAPADQRRQRGGARPRRVRGLLERLEQRQPVGRGRRGEHAAGAADHGRDTGRLELALDQCRVDGGCGPARRCRPGLRARCASVLPRSSRVSISAREPSSATTSAARSRAMKLRVESALGKPLAVRTTDGSVTSTSRTRRAPVARCAEQARGLVGGRR